MATGATIAQINALLQKAITRAGALMDQEATLSAQIASGTVPVDYAIADPTGNQSESPGAYLNYLRQSIIDAEAQVERWQLLLVKLGARPVLNRKLL